MEFITRLRENDLGVTYSLAFQFSQREVSGVERITEDPDNVPLDKILEMRDPQLILCFLRVFLDTVDRFNSGDRKLIEHMISQRRTVRKKRLKKKR